MASNILIVDGNKKFRESLRLFLIEREFNVAAVDNYTDAAELLKNKLFDIAIIDYFIGKKNAFGLCKKILNCCDDHTALIIMNQRQSSANELKIRALAPMYYIVKPFAIDTLYAVILKIEKSIKKKRSFGEMPSKKAAVEIYEVIIGSGMNEGETYK